MEYSTVLSTIFGTFLIEVEDEAVVRLGKCSELLPISNEKETPLSAKVYAQLSEYFNGERKSFDFPFKMEGTPFQKKVWSALCEIPYGETRSYKEIAIAIGSPKACRAVGMANNRNPIAIVIPCHRVIGSNGDLVGYAGGIEVKKALLKLEAEHK